MNRYNVVSSSKAVKQITAVSAAVIFVMAALFTSSMVFAQATVRDSSPIGAPGTTPSPQSPQGVDYQLITQMQQLQQEVLELRGLVEEQGFEIKRLKQQRLDDYLDLDKRIAALREQQVNKPNQQSGISTLSNSGSLAAASGATAVDPEAEKTLYRKAIDQLLNQQDYAGAQTSFNQYLSDYPQGIYAPNVHYWQGQIYITDSNKTEAEKSFSTLVNNYPDHQKTPDAKYKLATLYFDQGKKSEAKALLDEVAASDSDASRLAKAFLSKQYP